ncbi:MAG: LysR family transcriptional regulator, partial [Clostridia bacterium]
MIDQKIITLLKVNETKNFTKASLELSLTQPAVSQHIKQLERDLDVKIFIRGDNELRLTKDGEIVIKYAQRIMAIYANLEQALIDEKKRTTHLTIGITHTSESNAIAEVLATFSSLYDNIRIKMVTDTLTNLYGMLKTYELDLAIVEGKIAEKGLNSLLLDTDCLVLAVSNNNRLAKLSMVTIADLKKEKMILRLPNSGTRNLFIAHLESINMMISEFD